MRHFSLLIPSIPTFLLIFKWIGVAAWDATSAHRAAQSTVRLALTRLLAKKLPNLAPLNTSKTRSSPEEKKEDARSYSPEANENGSRSSVDKKSYGSSASKVSWGGVANFMTLADLTNESLDSTGTAAAVPWCAKVTTRGSGEVPAENPSTDSSLSSSSLCRVQLPPWPPTSLEDILCPPSDGGCRGGFVVMHKKKHAGSHRDGDASNNNNHDDGDDDDSEVDDSEVDEADHHQEEGQSRLQRQPRQWAVACSPELVQEASKAAARLHRPPNDRNYSGGYHSAAAAAAEMVEVASQGSTAALTAYLTGLVKRYARSQAREQQMRIYIGCAV